MDDNNILLKFGIRRLRGRTDSVSLTLPPAWIRDVGLGPVGLCYVDLQMDNQKRLIITPMLDMRDDAPLRKRELPTETNNVATEDVQDKSDESSTSLENSQE